MGRETQALVTFRGQSAETKVLLETSELILRGGHKARVPREMLSDVRAEPAGLWLSAAGEPLLVAMPEAEAARWAKAILTPPPSLASKFGIGPDKLALVKGELFDPAFAAALDGSTTADPSKASVLIACIENDADLVAAQVSAAATRLPLWCVYPKGKGANPGDGAIRSALRGAGWIDTKTCAVSERLTATRYAPNR